MRLQLINCGALGGWLTREGYEITNNRPDYTFEVIQTELSCMAIAADNITLENILIDQLRQLGEKTFLLDKSGVLSDVRLTLKVPSDTKTDYERGLFRTICMFMKSKPKVKWYNKLLPLLFLGLFTSPLAAQDGMTFIQLWTSSGPVYAADFANNAMRVICVAATCTGGGGGGGTSSTFGAAFPATGTAAGFIGSTGNMTGGTLDAGGRLTVTGAGGTFPVTGTFFQATQPVSGTFFQATQPVSIAANVPVTQVTSPWVVSGTVAVSTNFLTDAQLRASAVPVSGTFFQATQPISAVSLPLPTGASTSALQLAANHLVAQGTAAAVTAGWPVTPGSTAISTASWTSATAVDTRLTITVPSGGQVGCIVDVVGAISAGTINFEVSNDAGANFYLTYATVGYSVGPSPTSSSNSALALGDHVIHRPTIGDRFSLRLNPVITGAGTANIRCNVSAFPFAEAVAVTQVVPGNGGTSLGKAEDQTAASGDTGVSTLYERIDPTTTEQTAGTGRYGRPGVDSFGGSYEGRHPNSWSCFVQAATVMTQCQAAAPAGLRNYVTSFYADNQVASVQTVDVVFGTGANCATVPTALTHKFQMGTLATTTSPDHVTWNSSENNPLVPTAANAICCRPSAATAFGCTITGYTAR